ncbi:hypothetical protein GCM10027270_22850 [Nocardioides ginkgobilobae]
MSQGYAAREGHSRPETGPPGGLVSVLERWEAAGGHWEVLELREDWIEVALVSCDGEQMSRASSPRTSVLRSYLDDRGVSTD